VTRAAERDAREHGAVPSTDHPDDLAALTRRLADRAEIEQLKARYFYCLDTKRWDELRDLFTEDATFDPERAGDYHFDGLDGFITGASRSLANAVSVHHGHMPIIEFLSDTEATGIWAMRDDVEIFSDASRTQVAVHFIGHGHYHETYRRGDDGGWRISSWQLFRLRTDDLLN
jgi:hypothetical protein